jgi:hypothetical protein
MRGERQLLRLGEYLVRRACHRLPHDAREERYREWAAELPAILHDPQIRPAPRRAVRMLGYAADTFRGTMTPITAPRSMSFGTAALNLLLLLLVLASLALVSWDIWITARAPGHGLNYLQLAWALLLLVFPLSMLVRSTARMTVLIVISGNLAGVAVNLWNAAQAPEDWVNYFLAALCLLLLLALWLASRWARGGHVRSPGSPRVSG